MPDKRGGETLKRIMLWLPGRGGGTHLLLSSDLFRLVAGICRLQTAQHDFHTIFVACSYFGFFPGGDQLQSSPGGISQAPGGKE